MGKDLAYNRYVVKVFLLIITVIFSFAGCAGRDHREIIDRTGRKVVLNAPVKRILSAAPSNTEIIVDLGQADRLVAIDKYSGNVTGIPEGIVILDFSYPNAEAIVSLAPDIIIANGHNTTVSGDDPFRMLREMGIAIAYLSMSKSIEDIYLDIAFIADLLEVPEEGERLIRSMRADIDEITEKSASIENRATVYFELSDWSQMTTFGRNSYINDMIVAVGARNIFENDNWVLNPGAESIIDRNPDVILTNAGFIDDPVGEVTRRLGFDHINAVINNRVYMIDPDSSMRPSARIIKSLRQMARSVYPEIYDYKD